MRLVTLFLLVALVLGSLWAWFNVPGFPDGHDAVDWFLLPGLCVVFVVSMYFVGGLVERRPRLLAVPDKAAFEALSPERRRLFPPPALPANLELKSHTLYSSTGIVSLENAVKPA